MVAGVFCQTQVASKIRPHDAFGMVVRCTDHDSYALLVEYVLSASSHSAGDDDVCPFVVQPAWKQARLMRRRINLTRTEDLPARSIRFENGKSFTVTEMGTQTTVGYGNRDDYVFFD